jgi:hypothetical protein
LKFERLIEHNFSMKMEIKITRMKGTKFQATALTRCWHTRRKQHQWKKSFFKADQALAAQRGAEKPGKIS